ncbi:hypothetical protein PENDEC_c007G07018 [Penicillium decumbens]|uniref:inorganic diphosphatase n=1 Tax=Penicillium decumbens TaxID=69771 RepID=A0A1V6PEZ0_PENDC|nr:hypothetical protein PENDEC_c007G07018 [Penicillium decumbens]
MFSMGNQENWQTFHRFMAIPATTTWEDPNTIDDKTGIAGDDDPLDICEIGNAVANCGEVKKVKPLGAFALLDKGETDWKVIAIDVCHPLATKLSDIGDVEKALPGFLESLKSCE